jgi:ATP-binding cassette, subfamily A (ABC1), member 3
MRAAFVSVNLFSLLCSGEEPVTTSRMGDIMRYGGPILYLILYSFFLFGVLVWHDSGSLLRAQWRKPTKDRDQAVQGEATRPARPDVEQEAREVAQSGDALRVLRVSKSFEGKRVVDNVSFGVALGTTMALLGPNGAGKTTTFNMIRECSFILTSASHRPFSTSSVLNRTSSGLPSVSGIS